MNASKLLATLLPATRSNLEWTTKACEQGGNHWVSNSTCLVFTCRQGAEAFPITHSLQSSPNDCYTGSLLSSWVRYTLDEIRKVIPSGLYPVFPALMAPLGFWVRWSGLDRAAIFNNWLVSTNLHPNWSPDQWESIRQQMTEWFPNQPIAVRNICDAVQPGISRVLEEQGWILIPARAIYLCDPRDPALWKRNNVKMDQKLLDQTDVKVLGPDNIKPEMIPTMQKVFRALFLDKHSKLNPDFSSEFFEMCLRTHFLDLYALEYQGEIVGAMGLYERHGTLTVPLLGYETELSQKLGLYRKLMALMLREARQRQCILHYSSGAAQFKMARGGVRHLEYTAVLATHLGFWNRLILKIFAAFMQWMVPLALRRAGA
jgi:hypothetical protein